MEDQQERSSQSHAVVDIQSLVRKLEEDLARHHQVGGSTPGTPTVVIGMVGERTRNVDPQEYDPQHVSIGPYHRKRKPKINDKIASLNAVLSAVSPDKKVKEYVDELATDVDHARRCYANTFDDMTSEEFLSMLLLDACYLLNWLLAMKDSNGQDIDAVLRDVFYLVENQIPYFIIDKVHKLTFSGDPRGDVPAWVTIAKYLSDCILQKQQYTTATITPPAEPGNLLHLVHMHFKKPTTTAIRVNGATSSPTTGQQKVVVRWRTAMEYHISGVNLKGRPVGAGQTDASCILDVQPDSGSGTLVVPRLRIDAETGRILRNLIALEQQNPEVGSHVTAYCVFMSQISCTASDVELLSRRGIIEHLLGNHGEVATFFSDLCKGVLFDPDDDDQNYLKAVCQDLDKWYRSRRRRWMALLWHKYFANPWLAMGVMAAALGLIATLVQTVYTVMSYYISLSTAK